MIFRLLRILALLLLLVGGFYIWVSEPKAVGNHYGYWSLVPAGVTILMCFATRNVLLALLLGIASGGLIIHSLNLIDAFLIPSIASENFAKLLVIYFWALGGLLGIWSKNGGARQFANTASKLFIRSRRSAKMFAWVMGCIFHQGGTTSTVLTGTTVRSAVQKHKVASEELAYVVDSTASPIATIIPFNGWPLYIAGLLIVVPSLASVIPTEQAAVSLFYSAIPFNFYAIFAVLMTFFFSMDRLPLFGTPMRSAMRRAQETGQWLAPNAVSLAAPELSQENVPSYYKPSSVDFLLPLLVLLGFCIAPWILTGNPWVFEGFAMALVTAMVLTLVRGLSVKDTFDGLIAGIKGVTLGAVILGLAVTLGSVSAQVGAAAYVVEYATPWLQAIPYILPSLLLLVCMIISFSIGTSFGTYAIIFPIALPLALALSPDVNFLVLTFAAILGGAVFGDQCSPISDTTILSAMATGSDLMSHVNTQFPLALIAAFLAGILYFLLGFLILV